jgi:endonuclease YncB( thermonuclease family)
MVVSKLAPPVVATVVALSALSAVLLGAGPAAGTAEAAPPVEQATVASVYDGDTLTLTDGRRVRLLQIDTPELGSGECYSRAARTALLRLAPPGARIALEVDAGLDRIDRYGRLLRYVRRDGVNVNLELVRSGAAAPYFYRGERGRYARALAAAATGAKGAQRGLWKACPATVLDPDRAVETGQSGPPASRASARAGSCDPSYRGACLDASAADYDCAGGSGNGPLYTGPVRVVGADHFRLDGDGDGRGCDG